MTTTQKNWNGRGTLQDLVKELDRQRESKLDFVADARTMNVAEVKGGAHDGGLALEARPGTSTREFLGDSIEGGAVPMLAQAIEQIGQRVDPRVPTKFCRELAQTRPNHAAALLTGLMHDTGKRHLVRCLDGRVRAFLSAKYRVLDHYDLAFTSLDTARHCNGEVIEAQLSDRHMRIRFTSRAVFDSIRTESSLASAAAKFGSSANGQLRARLGWDQTATDLPAGPETVFPLITVANSETGFGGLTVTYGLIRGACVNGMIFENVIGRVHVGAKMAEGIFTEETHAADSKAIMLKCRDVIRAAFEPEKFRKAVGQINAVANDAIEDSAAAVDAVIRNTDLTEGMRDGILEHFCRDYRPTRYGLAQAVSRFAQDTEDPDAATDLEAVAGKIAASRAVAIA